MNQMEKNDDDQQINPLLVEPPQKQDPEIQKQMIKDHLAKGRELLAGNQYLLASKEFSKVILAVQYVIQNGQMQIMETKDIVEKALTPAYLNLSLCYLKLENYPSVIQLTSQILMRDPDNIKARYRRSFAYHYNHQHEQALQDIVLLNKLSTQMKNSIQLHELKQKCDEAIKGRKEKEKKVAKSWLTQKGGLDYPQRQKSKQQKLQQIVDQIQKQNNSLFLNRVCKCLMETWIKLSQKFKKKKQ